VLDVQYCPFLLPAIKAPSKYDGEKKEGFFCQRERVAGSNLLEETSGVVLLPVLRVLDNCTYT